MADHKSPLDAVPGSINRGAVLGLGVFALFIVVGGVIWAVGSALGLTTAGSFFLAACSAPILVAGVVLLWLYRMPAARRQRMLGVTPAPSTPDDPPDEPSTAD